MAAVTSKAAVQAEVFGVFGAMLPKDNVSYLAERKVGGNYTEEGSGAVKAEVAERVFRNSASAIFGSFSVGRDVAGFRCCPSSQR